MFWTPQAVIQRHFEYVPFPNHDAVFFYAVEIVDLLLSLPVIKHSAIADAMAELATIAYPREYVPARLPVLVGSDA